MHYYLVSDTGSVRKDMGHEMLEAGHRKQFCSVTCNTGRSKVNDNAILCMQIMHDLIAIAKCLISTTLQIVNSS
jgi:hypothetical protein